MVIPVLLATVKSCRRFELGVYDAVVKLVAFELAPATTFTIEIGEVVEGDIELDGEIELDIDDETEDEGDTDGETELDGEIDALSVEIYG